MINPIVAAARAAALRRAHEARDDQVERDGDGRLMFHSATSFNGAGVRFTVYDVNRSEGRLRKLAPESADATHRVFVMADSSRWIYRFKPGEGRALRAQLLELQLDAATYVNNDRAKADGR